MFLFRRMWETVIVDTLARRPNKKVDYVVLRSEQVRKFLSVYHLSLKHGI